jgi:nitric oxide reductase subunit B
MDTVGGRSYLLCAILLGDCHHLRARPAATRAIYRADGTPVMTASDIVAGKAGFQKADLMDYRSLYGMGSYFGQDYTAFALERMATLTEENLAQTRFSKALNALSSEQQASVRDAMRRDLQGIDLTKPQVTLPQELANAVGRLRSDMADNLGKVDLTTGWTPAYSLNHTEALQTAAFIIYSALTTVARRPDTTWSWTENWPYEPEVGNLPTTNTFAWTWASFCFTFLAFGGVLFIYKFWLDTPDDQPMETALVKFRPLTPSQRKVGKYFMVVALVLLAQIAAGAIMAHAYYDRRSFSAWSCTIICHSIFSATSTFRPQSFGSGWPGSALGFSWPRPWREAATPAVKAFWLTYCFG